MKLALRVVAVLIVLAGLYLGAAHLSGAALPTLGLPLGGAQGEVRRAALQFLEDLQFKDFDHAATFHDPALQEAVDIPFLLQRLFVVKPEALEIVGYEVVMADMDSTGDRARVKMRVSANDLIREKPLTREVVLYFHRDAPGAPWYMSLEDSLRPPEAEKDKKH